MPKIFVGVDVGGTKIAYGLFDEGYNLIVKTMESTNLQASAAGLMDEMSAAISSLVNRTGCHMGDVGGVGMCFPSNVVYEKGYILTTSNIPNLSDIYVTQEMEARLGVKVRLDNDANVAAAAEHYFGAGQGRKNMLYITLSTGIGAGIIIGNQLFRGDDGFAGEVGHVLISEDGMFECGCGNRGCAESIASGAYMERYAREICAEDGAISVIAGGRENIRNVHIGQALAEGDETAIALVKRDADYIGRLFASLFQIFNINTYIYGGGLVKIGPMLMEEVRAAFERYTKKVVYTPVEFLPAKLKDDAGMRGAALLIDKY